MEPLLVLECLFIVIAFIHRIRRCAWCYAAWVLAIPGSLLLSLIMDIADRGAMAFHDPFFILCLRYLMGLSLLAASSLLLRKYGLFWQRRGLK